MIYKFAVNGFLNHTVIYGFLIEHLQFLRAPRRDSGATFARSVWQVSNVVRLFCVFLVWLPAAALAQVMSAKVERDGDAWVISWESDRPVTIHMAMGPEDKGEVIARRQRETYRAELDIDGRPYFLLDDGRGEAVRVAERLLPLEGGRNFRDLGGYTTPDGKRVKWGKVFRSGMMADLTDSDYDYLSDLGIKVVCDLREREEREAEPTEWRTEPAASYVTWNYGGTNNQLMRDLFDGGVPTAEQTRDVMTQFYHEIAYEHGPRYEFMFDQLASGNVPLAFNCSAGKDRAGTGAALILAALGVERQQIVHDYSLSETYVDYIAEFREAAKEAGSDSPYAFLAQLPVEVMAPLMRSDPAYIEATFRVLEENHGSVLAFIQSELNVTDSELAAIRSSLLE